MEVMPNYHQESSVNSSPQVSNEGYTVIVTETTDVPDPDEFVLDLTTLPLDSDDIFDNIGASNETILPHNHSDPGHNLAKGIKRSFDNEYDVTSRVDDEIESSGYESDSEHDEDIRMLNRKKKKIKRNKNDVQRSLSNNLSTGEKRKYCEEENFRRKIKRVKTSRYQELDRQSSSDSRFSFSSDSSSSSSDSSSDSSSSGSDSSSCSSSSSCTDSNTSSDSSSSDNDSMNEDNPYKYLNSKNRIILCPKSCVCKAGPSMPPNPIFRTSRTIQPLYKKLLKRRLLSMSNTFYQTCCSGECYRDWARKRVTIARMVRDYAESDLRVDYFSWGKWKQEPEVDVSGSSDEDWF